MLIEDVACPVDKLADMTVDLVEMFKKFGYKDASCFGHALEGNLHLVFSQVQPQHSPSPAWAAVCGCLPQGPVPRWCTSPGVRWRVLPCVHGWPPVKRLTRSYRGFIMVSGQGVRQPRWLLLHVPGWCVTCCS